MLNTVLCLASIVTHYAALLMVSVSTGTLQRAAFSLAIASLACIGGFLCLFALTWIDRHSTPPVPQRRHSITRAAPRAHARVR